MNNNQKLEIALQMSEEHPSWTPDCIIKFVEYLSKLSEESST